MFKIIHDLMDEQIDLLLIRARRERIEICYYSVQCFPNDKELKPDAPFTQASSVTQIGLP